MCADHKRSVSAAQEISRLLGRHERGTWWCELLGSHEDGLRLERGPEAVAVLRSPQRKEG